MRLPSLLIVTLPSESGSRRVSFRYHVRLVSGGPELMQARVRGEETGWMTGEAVTLAMLGDAALKHILKNRIQVTIHLIFNG